MFVEKIFDQMTHWPVDQAILGVMFGITYMHPTHTQGQQQLMSVARVLFRVMQLMVVSRVLQPMTMPLLI